MERSEKIGQLIDALAKARKLFKPVLKRSDNPYFHSKYADIAEQIAATQEGLSANQLAVMQFPEYDAEAGFVTVETLIAHVSDEWMSNVLRLPVAKGDAQGAGSAITYARRYGYGSILNIASEADDDGNAATGVGQKDRGQSTTDKSEKKGRTINDAQLRALWSAFKSSGKTEAQLRIRLTSKYGVEHTKEILKTDFEEIMQWITRDEPTNMVEDVKLAADAAKAKKQPELASPELDFST